ncbi:cytochrome c biogenesis protein ResB, partial [Patescibacteria group bacterium]|nr:cytochrome c biogenesis protein ResB [Patescibacteria group bacterium]
EGNIHLMPSGEIVMSDFRGREVAKLSISPATVLPKTTKDLEVKWDKKYLLGRFTAQAKILYGSENNKLESEPAELWIVPWVPLSFIIGLLTLFVTFFILVRRRIFLAIKVLLGKAEVWELKKLKLK